MSKVIKIGTRKSKLALAQTEYIAKKIKQLVSDITVELITFDTQGDIILDKPMHEIGSKGLFTYELEQALLSGDIHLAVHSLKDLPTDMPDEFELIAIPERESPFDSIILSSQYSNIYSLGELPAGSIVGTSSLRRQHQLKYHYPHLEFTSIRGNINTRLNKIKTSENNISGGILAEAGLSRLNLQNNINSILTIDKCMPAAGQGALAVQISSNLPGNYKNILKQLNCHVTNICVTAERLALNTLGGGCQIPFGAYASVYNNLMTLNIAVSDKQNNIIYLKESMGVKQYKQLGNLMGQKALELL